MPVQSRQDGAGCVSAGLSTLQPHPAVACVVAAAEAMVTDRRGPDVNLRPCGRCRSLQSVFKPSWSSQAPFMAAGAVEATVAVPQWRRPRGAAPARKPGRIGASDHYLPT